MTDYSLLPKDKSFSELLPAFLFPYAAYVGLGSLPPAWMRPETAGLLRFAIVLGLLWFFRKRYRFGTPLTPRLFWVGLAGAGAACALWVAAYRLSLQLPWWHGKIAAAASARPSFTYWILRAASSTLLVPIFEELFCRGYAGEFFTDRRMEAHPVSLNAPPLSAASVAGSTFIFTMGHDPSAWIPAVLYFLFTQWLYAKTGCFRVCIAVHAFTNLAIAALVWGNPALQFLWF